MWLRKLKLQTYKPICSQTGPKSNINIQRSSGKRTATLNKLMSAAISYVRNVRLVFLKVACIISDCQNKLNFPLRTGVTSVREIVRKIAIRPFKKIRSINVKPKHCDKWHEKLVCIASINSSRFTFMKIILTTRETAYIGLIFRGNIVL